MQWAMNRCGMSYPYFLRQNSEEDGNLLVVREALTGVVDVVTPLGDHLLERVPLLQIRHQKLRQQRPLGAISKLNKTICIKTRTTS